MTTKKSIDKGLHLIRCECGAKILLIPDKTELGKSIEAHANIHAKKMLTAQNMEDESNRIQDLLIAQTLQLINQTIS
jgi:hypothetical protein